MISQAAQTTWKGGRLSCCFDTLVGGWVSAEKGLWQTRGGLPLLTAINILIHHHYPLLNSVAAYHIVSLSTHRQAGQKSLKRITREKGSRWRNAIIPRNGKSGDVRLSLRPAPVQTFDWYCILYLLRQRWNKKLGVYTQEPERFVITQAAAIIQAGILFLLRLSDKRVNAALHSSSTSSVL